MHREAHNICWVVASLNLGILSDEAARKAQQEAVVLLDRLAGRCQPRSRVRDVSACSRLT